MEEFAAVFADLEDPRTGNAKRHELLEILLIVSVARESGSERLLIAPVVGRVPCSRSGRGCRRAPQWRQHFLNFLPLPHGQGSFRPTPLNGSTDDWGVSAYARPASPGLVARRS